MIVHSLIGTHGEFVGTTQISTFSIDHQASIFGDNFKTLKWTQAGGCSGYNIKTTFCNNSIVPKRTWDTDDLQERTVSIPTLFLTESDVNGNLVYFNLFAVNGTPAVVCPNPGYIPDIAIQPNG